MDPAILTTLTILFIYSSRSSHGSSYTNNLDHPIGGLGGATRCVTASFPTRGQTEDIVVSNFVHLEFFDIFDIQKCEKTCIQLIFLDYIIYQ